MIGLFILAFINIAAQLTYVGCDLWLSHWTYVEEKRISDLRSYNLDMERFNSSNLTVQTVSTKRNIGVYSGLTFAVFVFGMLRALFIFHVSNFKLK